MSRTREESIAAAGRALADAISRRDSLSPHQAALEAYVPGGPSVDELEDRIRRRRAQHAALAS